MTDTKGNTDKEIVAQGLGNLATGFFGGMGGDAMVGQSIINVKSGGRTRISALVAPSLLLIFILFGASLINVIQIGRASCREREKGVGVGVCLGRKARGERCGLVI